MQVLVSGQIPLEIEIGGVDRTVSKKMAFSADVALHGVGFSSLTVRHCCRPQRGKQFMRAASAGSLDEATFEILLIKLCWHSLMAAPAQLEGKQRV